MVEQKRETTQSERTAKSGDGDGAQSDDKPAEKSRESKASSENTTNGRADADGAGRKVRSARTAARMAAREVAELSGLQPEAVVSVERLDDGWRVGIEVVESHRVPESADIMAVYEAGLDEDGELTSLRRAQRYVRGRTQN